MGWIDKYKNEGPWDFIEQKDKPHYNEGNLISDHDNPVWELDHLAMFDDPVTPTHHPWCGYWTKSYTPPIYTVSPSTPPPTTLPPGCVETYIADWDSDGAYHDISNDANRVYLSMRDPFDGFRVFLINGNFVHDEDVISPVRGVTNDDNYIYQTARFSNIPVTKLGRVIKHSKSTFAEVANWTIGPDLVYGESGLGIIYHNGYLYVTSTYGLHKYSTMGALIWQVNVYNGSYEYGKFSGGRTLDANDTDVYIADYNNARVVRFSTLDGSFVAEYSAPMSPRGLTILGDYIYMSHGTSMRIYDLDMVFICSTTAGGERGPVCNNAGYFYGVDWYLGATDVYRSTITVNV